MGSHVERRDRAGEAEGPTQPGSGSSSGKKQALQPSAQERSHMPAVGLPGRGDVLDWALAGWPDRLTDCLTA